MKTSPLRNHAMANRPASLPKLLKRVLSDSPVQASDRELLECFVASGNQVAFATLLDRHGPVLLSLCRRQLSDGHLAEDVLQATFLVLARKARTIRRRDNVAGWLYGVAQRLVRQARLSEAARSRRQRLAAAAAQPSSSTDPAWDEILLILDEEMRRLPERFRGPLLLCYLEGRTQDEAAKQLNWSLSTLRRRLESGRELLRTRMVRRGATLGAGLMASVVAPSAVRAALTAELHQAVLTVAASAGSAAVSPTILVLAHGELRMALFAKWLLGSAL
jgi:RNA polymerase sigma factor (sigma-70 family)